MRDIRVVLCRGKRKGLDETFFETEAPTEIKRLAASFINQKYLENRHQEWKTLQAKERSRRTGYASLLNGSDERLWKPSLSPLDTGEMGSVGVTSMGAAYKAKVRAKGKSKRRLGPHDLELPYQESSGQEEVPSRSDDSKVFDFLREREFSESFCDFIAKKIKTFDPKAFEDKKKLALAVSHVYTYSGDVKMYYSNPNLIFFVGPTGVGKTTTLSKIASRFILHENKTVVMATFDVRRIMATAQLETYANIVGVPFRVLREKSDFKTLVKDFIDKNLIFIDTAGTSQHDHKHIDEIGDYIDSLTYPKEVCLCLNASFRYKDLHDVMKSFRRTHFNKILITKADESYSLGSILSVAYESKVPLSFITDGQDVPNDIRLLTAEVLEEFLLREWT